MPYCALADITALIPAQTVVNLADDAAVVTVAMLTTAAAGGSMTGYTEAQRTATTAALAKVTVCIADADAEIDSYCAARYLTPFDPVPPVIVKCSVDIAIYNLYSRCAEKIPETRAERYKNTIDLLKSISKGVVTLGVVPVPEANPQGGGKPLITSNARIFTRESMRDY